MNDKYKIIGPLYDFLATIFSFGQIDKCKTAMHEHINVDDKVVISINILHGAVVTYICGQEAMRRPAEIPDDVPVEVPMVSEAAGKVNYHAGSLTLFPLVVPVSMVRTAVS